MTPTLSLKSFFSASIGTLIEYYDCMLFAIFLPIISPIFFPGSSTYESLTKGYMVFFISMLARPLGGLFFGYFGDIFGRRRALLSSVYGIALATTIIGITPSYAVWGAYAIAIIMVAKSVQLFCFGGEFNGAGIYVVEHAQNKNEGLMGSLLTATTLFGALMASLVGVICTFSFMPSWSWRVAFILGGLIGVLGIIFRKNLTEVPHFKQAQMQRHGFVEMIKKFPKELLTGVFIGGFATVPFTTVLTFICPVLMTKGYLNSQQLMLVEAFLTAIAIVSIIIFGRVADKKSPLSVMKCSCLLITVFSYPLLLLVDTGQFIWIILAAILFIMINEILLAPVHAYMKNLFPMQYRYRASSLSFGLGMSLMGGMTPLIESYCYQLTNRFSTIAVWLIFVGVGTFLMIRWVESKQKLSILSTEQITA